MEKEITETYDLDSKRYRRFLIDNGQEITGMIYVPKTEKVPDAVLLRLRTRGEGEAHEKG